MKKQSILFFLFLLLFPLVACSQTKDASSTTKETSSSATSTTISSGSVGEATTETAASTQASEQTDARFNGNYYSVQGKYDEIIIVNKKHPLSASYNPGENPTARAAFGQLVSAMRAAGYDVSDHYSGFRSYETQTNLYNQYVANDGQANADRYSARPGYSEHQTGLAFDLIDSSGNLLQESGAVHWLAEHAHQYGFIVRYIAGKEKVTGYMPETWHIRYVGQEAKDIYQSGQTLEEYFGVAGGDYE